MGRPEDWGPWRTVKTGPDRSRGARFLYLGDAQTGLESWGRLLKAAYRRHPDIDFILLAGDLVDRGNERTNWDHFFLRAAGVFDRVPLMPCVGNHEYLDMGPRLYRAFFELPRNGPTGIDPDLVYHFECGDACFAVLDSTTGRLRPEPGATPGGVARRGACKTARRHGNSCCFTTPSIRRIPGATRRPCASTGCRFLTSTTSTSSCKGTTTLI